MGVIVKILGYVAWVIVAGALLAPPLYELVRGWIEAGYMVEIAHYRFPKYLNRAVLVVALVGLYPFLRSLGLSSWQSLGIEPNPNRWRHLGLGLSIGACGLALGASAMLWDGAVTWKDYSRWRWLPEAMGAAAAVSIIEELLFRVAIFGALRQHLTWERALAFLSIFFAAVHFIRPHSSVKAFDGEVSWFTGFTVLKASFWQFGEPALLVGGLLTLTLVGALLGYTVVRTKSAYLAIGLHAGWVFVLKLFGLATKRVEDPGLWFGRDLITGLGPVMVLVLTSLLVVWLLRPGGSQIE